MSNHEIAVPISILALLIVVTNAAVAVLVLVNRELRRSCTNNFVVSLAVSDVLLGTTLFVQYALGVSSPLILNVMYSTALLSSVANLGAVSLDRYLAVVRPFKYCSTIPRYFCKIILASWITSLVTACLPVTWRGNRNLLIHKIYQFSVLFLGILLPFALILFSYWRIYLQVRKCVQRERRLTQSVMTTYHQKKLSTEAKIAKVFAVVCLTFVLAWLPVIWTTSVVAMGRIDLIPKEFTVISPFTLALGSIGNPVLYAFMKPDIRNAAVKFLPKKLEHLSAKKVIITQYDVVEYSTRSAGNNNNNSSSSSSSRRKSRSRSNSST